MNGQQFQKMVPDVVCADCADIAHYLYDTAGGTGYIFKVTPHLRENLHVYENGVIDVRKSYRQVYSDGQCVYDPRVSSEPIQ
ncbi:hypothetical protein D3C71_1887980 [compost metagenome]|jgi:hypothetical protein